MCAKVCNKCSNLVSRVHGSGWWVVVVGRKDFLNNTARFLSSSTPPLSFIERAAKHGAKSLIGRFPSRQGRFDDQFSKALYIDDMDTDRGIAYCSFVVGEELANGYGTLHGGAVATIVDIMGTLALVAKDQHKAGVSVDLNVTYVAPAKLGERVVGIGRTLKIGKMLGFTEVDLHVEVTNGGERRLIATGRHTKAFPLIPSSSSSTLKQ